MSNHIDKTNPNHITYIVHTCTRRNCSGTVKIKALFRSRFNCPDCGSEMKRSTTQPV